MTFGVVAVVAFLLLLPILVITELPLLDYPNHLASAYVLAHLHDPGTNFAQYFRADWGPYPYLSMDLLLVVLQRVVSIDVAGRIFCALAVLSVPVGLWFLLRRVDRQNGFLALLACAVVYDEFMLQGFLQFVFALGLGLFTLGVWLWYLERPSAPRVAVVVVCVYATYFSHLIVFAMLALIFGAYCLLDRKSTRLNSSH